MRYFSYNTYYSDPSVDPYVETLSEGEILREYWHYWYDKMCENFGREHVDQNYSTLDCIDDWCIVHWAWESK